MNRSMDADRMRIEQTLAQTPGILTVHEIRYFPPPRIIFPKAETFLQMDAWEYHTHDNDIDWIKNALTIEKVSGDFYLLVEDHQIKNALWAKVDLSPSYEWVEPLWNMGNGLYFMPPDLKYFLRINGLSPHLIKERSLEGMLRIRNVWDLDQVYNRRRQQLDEIPGILDIHEVCWLDSPTMGLFPRKASTILHDFYAEKTHSNEIDWLKHVLSLEHISGEFYIFYDNHGQPNGQIWTRVTLSTDYEWFEPLWAYGQAISFLPPDMSYWLEVRDDEGIPRLYKTQKRICDRS